MTPEAPAQICSTETEGLTGQIEEAKKDIGEMTQKCEAQIVKFAAQVIRTCEKNTLRYMKVKLRTIKAETVKRRIELLENLEENILQYYDVQLRVEKEELQKYKKETLRIIEEDAITQVEKTVNEIAEKARILTMEDLVHLIETPLNTMLKNTRKNAVYALDILKRNFSKYLDSVLTKIEQDMVKEVDNENLRCDAEIMKTI